MTRHLFLGGMADWATDFGADETSINSQSGVRVLFIPDATLTFYGTQTGGTQVTDLLDALGTSITSVTADSTGEFPQIQGPDTSPETWSMWADGNGGAGPRRIVVATDMGDVVNGLASTVDDMAAQLDALSGKVDSSMGTVSYDAGSSSWPTRPAGDSRRFAWFGPSAPPTGGAYLVENFDVWFNTAPAA